MKWGILATGVIARKFADTINQMPGESLAAVGSRTLEQAKAFADEYKAKEYYASYEELAADPEVEAIYVSTPNSMHFENCRMCLNAGKHVLCEKPFTTESWRRRSTGWRRKRGSLSWRPSGPVSCRSMKSLGSCWTRASSATYST